MQSDWLNELDQDTVLVVPTRSLATALNERIAKHQLALGRSVWEAPNIQVWSDFLHSVWQLNRGFLSQKLSVTTLISAPQALLLWTQVIETSRRQESELTLLNVQQTARAAQRSWRLSHDWRIPLSVLRDEPVADTAQFMEWADAYAALLKKRALIDESSLLGELTDKAIKHPFRSVVLVSYDLLTGAQTAYFDAARAAGVEVAKTQPQQAMDSQRFNVYQDSKTEIERCFEQARVLLEQDSRHRVAIVIPDLQHRYTQVQELARRVFYPQRSPLDILQNNKVYTFSLGEVLIEWPAIEAALSVLTLLKGRTTTSDICFVLRNDYLSICADHREECRQFERWLKRQRIHNVSVDSLPLLFRQSLQTPDGAQTSQLLPILEQLVESRLALVAQLQEMRATNDFAALSFNQWITVINDWLARWGWRTTTGGDEMSSVQYQLLQRWNTMLTEFAALAVVQRRAGLSRVLELLQQMARNTIFLPKAAASPILISGVLEAIGREVDTCFLTGMDQSYPKIAANDAFIPQRLLIESGHPEASPETGYLHSLSVVTNLLACARDRRISYARSNDQDHDIAQQPSALFNDVLFERETVDVGFVDGTNEPESTRLNPYTDTQGPAWSDPSRARGGSRIFENQSNCAFKAFVTHQLGFMEEDESEFGLDALDRGNVLHQLLALVWDKIQTQNILMSLDHAERESIINAAIQALFDDDSLGLSRDKRVLLKREVPRLINLVQEWLTLECTRPAPFSVIESEERRDGTLAGIGFHYIIDRVDLLDDGRSVIIDYKTGAVNRSDWTGERIKSPQLPLYAVALDEQKNTPTSGIAFAKLKQGESAFIELADDGIFRKPTKTSQKRSDEWHRERAAWPQVLTELAEEFLAGVAPVNPIDQKTCQYCELGAVCRVSQLRNNTAQMLRGVEQE